MKGGTNAPVKNHILNLDHHPPQNIRVRFHLQKDLSLSDLFEDLLELFRSGLSKGIEHMDIDPNAPHGFIGQFSVMAEDRFIKTQAVPIDQELQEIDRSGGESESLGEGDEDFFPLLGPKFRIRHQ